jgi:hypothetical protein
LRALPHRSAAALTQYLVSRISHPANCVDLICSFAGNGPLIGEVGCARVTRMPTFYFSLTGRAPLQNVYGENLPTLVDAMEEAIGMARELARNKRARDVSGEQVVVTDGSGREVFRMPLRGAR